MKIDATFLLIETYSTVSMKLDEHLTLENLMDLSGIQDHLLSIPKFFVLKEEKPLEGSEDAFFLAMRLPKKNSIPVKGP